MATLQSTSITGTLTVNGAAVASRSFKFQEFTSSGTFSPPSALISAGGVIDVFLVGGGGTTCRPRDPAYGGNVIIKKMTLTSTSNISVTIGAGGGTTTYSIVKAGGNSVFNGASAGGVNITALGGAGIGAQGMGVMGVGWPSKYGSFTYSAAGSGVLGYGAGASGGYASNTPGYKSGVFKPIANSGNAAGYYENVTSGAAGYCLVTWFQ